MGREDIGAENRSTLTSGCKYRKTSSALRVGGMSVGYPRKYQSNRSENNCGEEYSKVADRDGLLRGQDYVPNCEDLEVSCCSRREMEDSLVDFHELQVPLYSNE